MYTESEMKEFFQRIVDQVAELSTQASRVEGLQSQVNDLYNRVNTLEQENARLVQQAVDANNTAARVEGELTHSRSQLESERSAVSALRETISFRDGKVQELEGYLQTERDAHKITLAERDDARTKAEELQASLSGSNLLLIGVTEDRDRLIARCNDLERQVAEYKQRLERVSAILSVPQVVFSSDVA